MDETETAPVEIKPEWYEGRNQEAVDFVKTASDMLSGAHEFNPIDQGFLEAWVYRVKMGAPVMRLSSTEILEIVLAKKDQIVGFRVLRSSP